MAAKVDALKQQLRELSPQTHADMCDMLLAAAQSDVPDHLQLLVLEQLKHLQNPKVEPKCCCDSASDRLSCQESKSHPVAVHPIAPEALSPPCSSAPEAPFDISRCSFVQSFKHIV